MGKQNNRYNFFFLKSFFSYVFPLSKREHFPSIRFNFEAIFYKNKTQFSPQPVPPIRKCVQDYYPHRSEGWPKRQELQSHSLRKKVTITEWSNGSQLCHGKGACIAQLSYELCNVGPSNMDRSWCRVLINCDLMEKEMANYSSIFASKPPCTVWKGKKI